MWHLRLQTALPDALQERRFYRPLEVALAGGEVKLWGHVAPARYGYRAQYAYAARLYVMALTGSISNPVLRETTQELARAYRVPASVAAR